MARTSAPEQVESPFRLWFVGLLAGLIAVGAVVAKPRVENAHGWVHHSSAVTWIAVVVVLVAGIVAVGHLAEALALLVMRRFTPAAGAVVRLVSTSLGYLVLVFAVFGVFGVSLTHLLIGFGLAGVVVGIAAQQSLGNIFASLVLLFARPFIVGDHIRIRSGSIGVIDATVLGIGLTYVTVRTDDGLLKVPNSVMLASGIGQLTPSSKPLSPAEEEPEGDEG